MSNEGDTTSSALGVSVNFQAAKDGAMAATDQAGVVRVQNWNNMAGPNSDGNVKTLSVAKDSTGAAVAGLNVTFTGGNSSGKMFANSGVFTNEGALFNGLYDQFDGTASTVAVTGIPYPTYDVYFYRSDDGAARAGSFTVGDTTYYVRGGLSNPANDGTGYVVSSDTTLGSGTDILQGNCVKFEGLTGTSFTCAFTAVNAGDNVQRNKVVGFQIIASGAQPPVTTPPPAPGNVTITASSTDATMLAWSVANGATQYRIYRSTTAGLFDFKSPIGTAEATATSYTDSTATGGKTYYYVVRAINSVGASGNSIQVSTPPPNLDSIAVSSPVIWPGQTTTITWAIPNATSLAVDNGTGAKACPTTGSLPVTLTATGTNRYTFTATNSQGKTSKTIPVTCVPKIDNRERLWQWSIQITGTVSGETNDFPRAFLYIPPGCTRVRGVVIGQHNMLEQPILEHTAVRQALADAGMAAIWVSPAFDPAFNFTAKPNVPALFQQMMDAFALESGYAELSKTPVVWIGHSAMSEAPYFFAAWDGQHSEATGEPRRCAAAISIKGYFPGKHDETVPNYSNSDMATVPILYIEGEYSGAESRAMNTLSFQNSTPGTIFSHLADAGGGHFDWNDRVCNYIGMYLRKIGRYRLPVSAAPDGTATLQTINTSTQGWLADRWHHGQSPTARPAPVGKYAGDPSQAFWYFDEEHAMATYNFNLPVKTTYQLVGLTQNGKPVPFDKTHFAVNPPFVPDPSGDGATFKLGTYFLDTAIDRVAGMAGLPAGSPIGHATDGGPILLTPICGPCEQLSPDTFAIRWENWGANNRGRSKSIAFMAVHPGDRVYQRAVEQANMNFPLPLTGGATQTIDFPKIADQPVGTTTIALKATTTGTSTYPGAKVQYYVQQGPAKVSGDRLTLTPIPPRAKFPVKVTVVATQYGRTIPPLLQTATPVAQTFYILGKAQQPAAVRSGW